jgi:hypothetical protein
MRQQSIEQFFQFVCFLYRKGKVLKECLQIFLGSLLAVEALFVMKRLFAASEW